jgi:hypothetical protein
MTFSKAVIALAVLALAGLSTPVSPAAGGARAGDLGVAISLDSRWITVEGYYSAGDAGVEAREEAWAGEPRVEAEPDADTRACRGEVRVVRIVTVPNPVGRAHHHIIAVRALTHAAQVITRRIVAAFFETVDTPLTGVSDADRR